MGALKIVTDDNELKEPKFNYKAELLKLVPNQDIVDDYIAVGKTMKRTPTKTGLTIFVNECDKHNLSYELAMTIVIDKGWRGFNYLWLKEEDFQKYGLNKKQPIKKEKPITMSEIKNIISEEEKNLKTKEQINQSYIAYMDDLITPNFPSIKFDFLMQEGLIKNIDETNAGYYAKKRLQAIEYLKEKYDPSKAITREERNKFRIANELLLNGTIVDIDVKVKELVLIDFFDSQIKKSVDKIFKL